MQRTTLLSLAFMALLCFQASAIPLFTSTALRTAAASLNKPSSVIIDIKTDSYKTFYVYADFSDYRTAQNASNPGAFMLSLVNDETIVTEDCFNFNAYDCACVSNECSKVPQTKTIDFPFLTADVQYAKSRIYLEFDHWSINPSNFLYIATSCSAGTTTSTVGSGRFGILGLGTGAGASKNFGNPVGDSPIFSIFLNSGLTEGKLLFNSDTDTYAQSQRPVIALGANSTWQTQVDSGYIQVGDEQVKFNSSIMFDINSDAIGLPSDIYKSFLEHFSSLPDIKCDAGYIYKPYCMTDTQLKDLPDIILSIDDDIVKIPAQIYATLRTDKRNDTDAFFHFDLNFKLISPNLSGTNFVAPSFANSIILDANFMSYYYTVFDAQTGANVIFLYESINVPSSGGNWWWILLILGVVLLVGGLCFCNSKKKKIEKNDASLNDINPDGLNTGNQSVQAPLVEKEQEIEVK